MEVDNNANEGPGNVQQDTGGAQVHAPAQPQPAAAVQPNQLPPINNPTPVAHINNNAAPNGNNGQAAPVPVMPHNNGGGVLYGPVHMPVLAQPHLAPLPAQPAQLPAAQQLPNAQPQPAAMQPQTAPAPAPAQPAVQPNDLLISGSAGTEALLGCTSVVSFRAKHCDCHHPCSQWHSISCH
jgi:hypothetical protein